jgi:hypothetical protein
MAIVAKEKAALKPESSQLVLADLQTDGNWTIIPQNQSLEAWIRREVTGRIGYDPTLTPIGTAFQPAYSWKMCIIATSRRWRT